MKKKAPAKEPAQSEAYAKDQKPGNATEQIGRWHANVHVVATKKYLPTRD